MIAIEPTFTESESNSHQAATHLLAVTPQILIPYQDIFSGSEDETPYALTGVIVYVNGNHYYAFVKKKLEDD